MRNHYFTPYIGNKRSEIKDILPLISLDNITTILEPFAGSAAMSFYISMIYPNCFKYILNDNDIINKELYDIARDAERTEIFNENINKIITEWNTYTEDIPRKAFYDNLDINQIEAYVFKRKYNNFRPYLYPSFTTRDAKRFINIKPYRLQDFPVYNFYNNENVVYETLDAIDFIKKHNNDSNKVFLLDPPYLFRDNASYNNFNLLIYAWVKNNKEEIDTSNNKFIFILEDVPEVKELFKDYKILLEYSKIYFYKAKKTRHIVFEN